MTSLMSLPSEVIDIILSYNDISFEDIINFRCVCKKFQWATKTTDYCFKKNKYFQRWPSAKKYYDKLHKENEQKKFQKDEQNNKKHVNFIKTSIYCVKRLRNYTSQMILSNFGRYEKSGLNSNNIYKHLKNEEKKMKGFKTENYVQTLFFMDEIEHLLTQPLRAGYDLMEGYYYIRLFDYLKIHHREYIFQKYYNKIQSSHKELLEESATILAQRLQPEKDVSYSSVKMSLNIIAQEALNFLNEKHPNHSIFTTPDECFSHWENNKIDDNYWSEAEGTQIMDALEEYMFGKLKFRSINSRDLEYTCIDYVLENKCGLHIIIFTIYHSIARRLGLRCDIASSYLEYPFKYTIQLLWVPRYTFPVDYERNISNFIDSNSIRCYNCIKFGKFPNCMKKELYYKDTYTMTFKTALVKIFDWMYKYYCYDIVHDDFKIYEIPVESPKARPHEIKFAVGMIVTHGDKSTDCFRGVIIGWNRHRFHDIYDCKCLGDIAEYVMPLRICGNYRATGERIYYIILTKNAKLCYVEEGAITLTKPNWIENRNIYRYFCKFEGTHYVPNRKLAKVYPHDAAITARTIFKH